MTSRDVAANTADQVIPLSFASHIAGLESDSSYINALPLVVMRSSDLVDQPPRRVVPLLVIGEEGILGHKTFSDFKIYRISGIIKNGSVWWRSLK